MTRIQLSLAASLGLALAGPVLAADPTGTTPQDREQLRAQVHHTITAQGNVSEQDANDIDAEVSSNAAHPGYGPKIKEAIQEALAESPPCKGTCLANRIHAINGAVAKGVPADKAVKTAKKTAHATGQPSDPDSRSDDHRQDMAHRDAASDRAHDHAMDHGQAGSHAMGAGHR